jgi:hypothetical protein
VLSIFQKASFVSFPVWDVAVEMMVMKTTDTFLPTTEVKLANPLELCQP